MILFSRKHMCWEKLFHRKMLLLDYELFWIFEKHFVAEQLNWKLRQLSKNRDRWHMGRKKWERKGSDPTHLKVLTARGGWIA